MQTANQTSMAFIALPLLLAACSMDEPANAEADFHSCDPFFASAEERDGAANPLNERVCLIEEESEVPVLYAERSGVVTWHDGVPVELFMSEDGEHIAMRSTFNALAAEAGATAVGDSAETGTVTQPVIAAGIAWGVRACARSMGCRMMAVKLGKGTVEAVTIGSVIKAGYEISSWFD